jgi:hypothetical protein
VPRRTILLISDGVQNAEFRRGDGVDERSAPYEHSDVQSALEASEDQTTAENLRLRQELLVLRDELIGQEARLGEALGRIELLESDLGRYRDAVAEAERLLGTRTGRLLRAWHRLRAVLRA